MSGMEKVKVDSSNSHKKDDIRDIHRKEVKTMLEKIDGDIMAEIDQAEKEMVDNFFNKGAGK